MYGGVRRDALAVSDAVEEVLAVGSQAIAWQGAAGERVPLVGPSALETPSTRMIGSPAKDLPPAPAPYGNPAAGQPGRRAHDQAARAARPATHVAAASATRRPSASAVAMSLAVTPSVP